MSGKAAQNPQEVDYLIDQIKMINARVQNFNVFGFRKNSAFATDKSGTSFEFLEAALIPSATKSCLLQLEKSLMLNADSFKKVAETCALFWMNFIAIHPFLNANRRTGIEYLQNRLQLHGYTLGRNHLFLKYTFGLKSRAEDIQSLTQLFCIDLNPIHLRKIL